MAFGTGKNKEAGCDWDGARAKGNFLFLQVFGFGDKGFLFNQNSRFGTFFTNDSYEKDASLTYTPATGVLTLLSELRCYRFSPQLLKPAGLLPNSVYNGKVQSIPLAPNEAYTITGTLLAERAGQYSVTVRLKDKENTSWSDGNTATETGTYTASVVLDCEWWNYNMPEVPALNWTIEEQLVTSLTAKVGGRTQATVYPNPLQAGNTLLVEMGAAPTKAQSF